MKGPSLTQFTPAIPFRSTLAQRPPSPHHVPPVDQITSLEQELRAYHAKCVARSKQAEANLKALEGVYKNANVAEKERDGVAHVASTTKLKGKGKEGAYKLTREDSQTPSVDEPLPANIVAARATGTGPPKRKHIGHPIVNYKDLKKKQKPEKERKRYDDDDLDSTSQSNGIILNPAPVAHSQRATHHPTPPPPQSNIHAHPKKPPKSHPHQPLVPPPLANPDIATDFSLPTLTTLVPPRPSSSGNGGLGYWGPGGLLHKGPMEPTEVMEDFTEVKPPPNQVQMAAFWKEVEAWIRTPAEEDVGWLEYEQDSIDVFTIPNKGRHYSEVWAEQDAAPSSPHPVHLHDPYAASTSAPQVVGPGSKWDPTTLAESDLYMQKKHLGALTERLVGAFLELPEDQRIEDDDDDDDDPIPVFGPKLGLGVGVTGGPVEVEDLEKRLRRDLKSHGLIQDEEPNYGQDDEVLSELRKCQSLLRSQMSSNSAMKRRVIHRAKDRLAYQDYRDSLDALGRQIASGHQKIVKSLYKGSAAKKKKGPGSSGLNGGEAEIRKAVILELPPSLMEKIELRNKFKEVIGTSMAKWDAKMPGRLIGLPQKSVYENLGEEEEDAESDDGGDGRAEAMRKSESVVGTVLGEDASAMPVDDEDEEMVS